MAGERRDAEEPPDEDVEEDEPDGPSVTDADELSGDDPGDGAADVGDRFPEGHDDTSTGGDGPSGTEVSVQVERPADPSGQADRAGPPTDSDESIDRVEPDAGRSGATDQVDGATRRNDPGSSPRSEDELEREILDPEERIGPDEEHCRHCGFVFPAREDSCPDCGSPHPRSVDPPASTRKIPELAAALSLLLPGAGHLYNEQFGRGALAFFGTVVLVAGIAFFGLILNVLISILSLGTLSPVGTLILVLAILFGWFLPVSVAAWDAYGQAGEINAG